ncbi:hypothetical protein SNE40_007910 [Patella caerulea]
MAVKNVYVFLLYVICSVTAQCRHIKSEDCCPSNSCPSQLPCSILYNQLGPFDECLIKEANVRHIQPSEVGAEWERRCVNEGLCEENVGACNFIKDTIVHDICYQENRLRVPNTWKIATRCN